MHRYRTLVLGFRWVFTVVSMLMLGVLSGCGGGGGGGAAPVTNADPTGYYENKGSLTITDPTAMPTTITRSDLQGIIYNNHLMMFSTGSNGPNYLYDADITINGNSFTGTGYAYKDALMLLDSTGISDIAHAIKLSVSGTITQGTSVSGSISGIPNTTISFALNYSTAVNAVPADLTKINGIGFSKPWYVASPSASPNVGGSLLFNIAFHIGDGWIDYKDNPTGGIFNGCAPTSHTPVVATTSSVILLDMGSMTGCDSLTYATIQNRYKGLAVYRIDTNTQTEYLELMMTNRMDQGLFAINGEFKL